MPRLAAPPELARLAVNTIKFLSIDAVEKAPAAIQDEMPDIPACLRRAS